MKQNYHTQFRRLQEEYRAVADKVMTMEGTFGDALWLGDKPKFSVDVKSKATAPCMTVSPRSMISTPHSLGDEGSVISTDNISTASHVHSDRIISHPIGDLEREKVSTRPRIGHKKSRAGCFNCKKRKIKCQENQPACHNCTRKSLHCVYPPPRTIAALRDSAIYSPSPVASVNLQATPQIFTMTDMRLFHHFLLDAYPHLPVGNDNTWLTHVPLLAHHNEYLMHAILGLAASHLEMLTNAPFGPTALYHRGLAIKGSNQAMSLKSRTGSDGDALLAACYLLIFQSTYLDNAIPEFFLFVRGCSLLSRQLRAENLPMAFLLTESSHFKFMEEHLKGLPVISPTLLDGAERSLLALPALFESSVHSKFYDSLIRCIFGVKESSLSGYFLFITIYAVITRLEVDEFHDFINPDNKVSKILIGHFLAIQILLFPILDREWGGRSKLTAARMNLTWISSCYKDTPPKLQHFLEWPKAIGEACLDELNGKQSIIPRLEILRKREGLSRNII